MYLFIMILFCLSAKEMPKVLEVLAILKGVDHAESKRHLETKKMRLKGKNATVPEKSVDPKRGKSRNWTVERIKKLRFFGEKAYGLRFNFWQGSCVGKKKDQVEP